MSISEQDAFAALTPSRRAVVRAGEWVPDHGRKAPGAVCHALSTRLAHDGLPEGGPEALERRLAALTTELLSTTATAALFRGTARLWSERVPCRSDDSAARRRRRRELLRPVVALRDAPVRAVLLRYDDDVADLVVVAHRAALGTAALHGFVARLLDAPRPAEREAAGAPAAGRPYDAARHAAELADCTTGDRQVRGPERTRGPEVPETALLPLPADHPEGDAESWTVALGVVLARYEGVDRPVVAAMVPDTEDGTPAPAVDGIALVPVAVDGANTLGTLDKNVRARIATGPAWWTGELLREVEAAGGDPSGLAGVGMVFADPGAPASPAGTPATEYLPFQFPPFPVTVSLVRDAAGDRTLRCDFSSRRLSPDLAEQFLRHVGRAHGALLRSPDTPVPDVRLLDGDELDHLDELGRPRGPVPFVPRRIDEAIAEIAATRPDAPAVGFEDTRLGYGELDDRANRLAHALRRVGVADGDRVGVCLERSAELIVTLLAVLKAGAVYVPMDPAHPRDRLLHIATDAELTTVVTDHAEFPRGDSVRVIGSRELAESAPGHCDGPPPSRTGPNDPAYVIHTSGSTGRPKGVVVPHANVLALMAATTGEFGLGEEDTWTMFHSSAFDFSVWEIWGCLLTGGRLVVVPYWVSRSPEDFHRLLLRERVSVLSQTPSAFTHLVEVERDGAEPAPVRLVVFGGEGLDPRILLPWFDRHPGTGCRVVNMYGITETTVHVTAQTVTRAEALAGSKSVGRPLPGWWVRVTDPAGRPVPVGVAGEIRVGGVGVASHYLNKPELTEERFPTDPRTGERMYRSGDMGRLLPDGRLEHLGRLDNQVKLRGFRIELDEIRSVLLDDPRVSAAAVLLNRTDPGNPATARIDAFVVMDGDDTAAVRQRAAGFLPEYMVPSTITVLDRMPLTTNGKLDPRELPRP
ncbi:amino acid adenylation domain-containing protein, partial [Streptomyces calidiresistens]|uniref:amino acid adenylation domain-containing protein n=1 Tax=Streptomyces calidiresistens TaxID=1485586 RepID=UPI002B1F7827